MEAQSLSGCPQLLAWRCGSGIFIRIRKPKNETLANYFMYLRTAMRKIDLFYYVKKRALSDEVSLLQSDTIEFGASF